MSDDPEAKANAKPGAAPPRLRPTIIEPPARTRRVKDPPNAAPGPAASDPVAPPRQPLAPTVIPGVARKRIAVSAAELTRLFPGAAPGTATRAARLVDGFVVEKARDPHVAAWGLAAQQRYAAFVADTPEPPQAEVSERARGYVARIAELLGTIDIETVCDARRPALPGFLEPAGDRIDTPRKLTAARAELEQLVGLTRAVLPPLLDLKTLLDDHARRADEAGLEIEAAALAALFLSDHLAPRRPELSRHFLQREMSLTKTALEIRGGLLVRSSRAEDLLALITLLQDAVLAPLPGWLAAVASARAARYRLNPTQAGDLQHGLRVILRKLQA